VIASLISKTGFNTEKFSHNGKKVCKWKPMLPRPLERPEIDGKMTQETK
jgi:hypothetical protein